MTIDECQRVYIPIKGNEIRYHIFVGFRPRPKKYIECNALVSRLGRGTKPNILVLGLNPTYENGTLPVSSD